MTNNSTYQNDCQAERDIRAALVNANGNGWWQMVADLTTELNTHNKGCPACNPDVSKGMQESLFGQVVKVSDG